VEGCITHGPANAVHRRLPSRRAVHHGTVRAVRRRGLLSTKSHGVRTVFAPGTIMRIGPLGYGSAAADEGMLAPHSASSQRETQRALSSPHTEKALGGYRRHGAGDARSQAFRCRGSKLDSGVDFSASNAKSRSENV
jgi:hypothetical protein